jgi:hypothetical protein
MDLKGSEKTIRTLLRLEWIRLVPDISMQQKSKNRFKNRHGCIMPSNIIVIEYVHTDAIYNIRWILMAYRSSLATAH